MASAEEKWKDELKDQQVMGSNANGAEGAEGKTGESNLSGKDPKDPSGEKAVLETSMSKEDAGNGLNVEFFGVDRRWYAEGNQRGNEEHFGW